MEFVNEIRRQMLQDDRATVELSKDTVHIILNMLVSQVLESHRLQSVIDAQAFGYRAKEVSRMERDLRETRKFIDRICTKDDTSGAIRELALHLREELAHTGEVIQL